MMMHLSNSAIDGWFNLLYRLCEGLEPRVHELNPNLPPGDHFEVLQVKQKFGGLRFYVSRRTDAIDAEVELAREDSSAAGRTAVGREGSGIGTEIS
jgi:hypothetical protein